MVVDPVYDPNTFDYAIYNITVSQYLYKKIVYVECVISHLLSIFEVAVTLPKLLVVCFLFYQLVNIMVIMPPSTTILSHPTLKEWTLIPYL